MIYLMSFLDLFLKLTISMLPPYCLKQKKECCLLIGQTERKNALNKTRIMRNLVEEIPVFSTLYYFRKDRCITVTGYITTSVSVTTDRPYLPGTHW